MTLKCECGSYALEFDHQDYPDGGVATERYRCELCGNIGTYRFGTRNGRRVDEMTGCLTTDLG